MIFKWEHSRDIIIRQRLWQYISNKSSFKELFNTYYKKEEKSNPKL